jgi:hypothetical protein
MEDELVSIDKILCHCEEEEQPRTWRDRVKNGAQILALALAVTIIAGLSCVGILNIVLDRLIHLP